MIAFLIMSSRATVWNEIWVFSLWSGRVKLSPFFGRIILVLWVERLAIDNSKYYMSNVTCTVKWNMKYLKNVFLTFVDVNDEPLRDHFDSNLDAFYFVKLH